MSDEATPTEAQQEQESEEVEENKEPAEERSVAEAAPAPKSAPAASASRPSRGGPPSRGPRQQDRRRGRYRPRRKVCSFCVDKVTHIDYKQVDTLRRFVDDHGKIRRGPAPNINDGWR
jgi:hypothetical protein